MATISQDDYERWLADQPARDTRRQRRLDRADRKANRRAQRADQPWRRALTQLGATLNNAVNDHAERQQRGVDITIDEATNELVYRSQREPLRGAVATVLTAGAVRARPTLTRFVAFGVLPGVPALAALAWWKSVDERELVLVIDGPDWQWAAPADPKRAAAVREFAARVNTLARRA
jgi:hypothetical protein